MIDLQKYNFTKTDKNFWVFWNDYLLTDINPEIGYYLKCTISIPKRIDKEKSNWDYDKCKIILHRSVSYSTIDINLENGDSIVVYDGYIHNDSDLEFLLDRLGIIPQKK